MYNNKLIIIYREAGNTDVHSCNTSTGNFRYFHMHECKVCTANASLSGLSGLLKGIRRLDHGALIKRPR